MFITRSAFTREVLTTVATVSIPSPTGGYDGNTFLDSVERYDPETDSWSEVTLMTSGRSGVGVAVTMEPCQKDLQPCPRAERDGDSASPPAHPPLPSSSSSSTSSTTSSSSSSQRHSDLPGRNT